ncbi:MAG: hypothetical protein R2839_03500 [Thermomicrobiales bacterium]
MAAFDSSQLGKSRLLAEMRQLTASDDLNWSLERRLAELDLQETWLLTHYRDKQLHHDLEDPGQSRAIAENLLSLIREERSNVRAEIAKANPARALLSTGMVRSRSELVNMLDQDEAVLDFFDLDDNGIAVFLHRGTDGLVWSSVIANGDIDRAIRVCRRA